MFVRWKKTPLARGGTRFTEYGETGCDHPHGAESIRLAPVIVESFRPSKESSPRQREVWRPGLSVRQCCINDRETFGRLYFWSSLDYAAKERFGDTTEEPWSSLREQIARVVPAPTPAEVDIVHANSHLPYARQPGQLELDVEHDRYRIAETRCAEWHRERHDGETFADWNERAHPVPRKKGSGMMFLMLRANGASCWSTLALKWPCSAQDIKSSYKRLVLKYHPDHGGTDQDFCRVTEAKNQALKFAARLEAIIARKAG